MESIESMEEETFDLEDEELCEVDCDTDSIDVGNYVDNVLSNIFDSLN